MNTIYIVLLIFLGILLLVSSVLFFIKGAYWPAFGCLCLITFIVNIGKISGLEYGGVRIKFKEFVNTLLLEKRQIEQIDVKVEGKMACVDLIKEPA